MNKVTNTSKNPRVEWLMGGNPNAIEAQETQGQKEVVESSQLPSKVNYPREIDIEEQYTLMGIKVIGNTEGDDLFLDVELPNGWKKDSTDHSMWNKLFDDKGRERLNFFYKAAFYDRDAFVNFTTRYNWQGNYDNKDTMSYIVKDNATGEVIFETKKISRDSNQPNYFEMKNELEEQCQQFLKDNFPEHEDINAYWD